MSALPPKADMCGALADVRFGPPADIAVFIHHTVEGMRAYSKMAHKKRNLAA
jgi:hypothetical protein